MQVEMPDFKINGNNNKHPIGADLGLTNLAVLSDGVMFENPHYLKQSVGTIKDLQRSLSRKPDSNNCKKARISLAKAWLHVKNQRLDFCHSVSSLGGEILSHCLRGPTHPEDVEKPQLGRSNNGRRMGQLRSFTAYKAERNGGRVMLVNPRGTSQERSRCHLVVPKDLSIRIHRCPRCGLVLDRDVNAARNVLRRGLIQARAEVLPPLVVRRRRISRFASLKQEVHGVSRG